MKKMCIEMFYYTAGNGLGVRVVGGKEVPGSDGEIGAYVAKVLPGGATEQTGKILEGEQRFTFLETSCQMLERICFILHERKSHSLGNFIFVNESLDDLGAL